MTTAFGGAETGATMTRRQQSHSMVVLQSDDDVTYRECGAANAAPVAGEYRGDGTPARIVDDVAGEWDARFSTPRRFAAFCQLHETAVYRIAYRILRDGQEAEEVAYDTFLRAHTAYAQHCATGEPFSSAPVPYLYLTTRNAAIDRYRKLKRRRTIAPLGELGEADVASTPHNTDLWEEEQLAVVRSCIAALASPHREVYAHYYLAELPVEEVATAVGLPQERVRAVLKSAREQIGRLLVPHLLATALGEQSKADRTLVESYYARGRLRTAPEGAAFEEARWRLIARLLRWEILFQRLPPEQHRALAVYARERDYGRVAVAVTALRRAKKHSEPCTLAEAATLTNKAVAWLDRRLRATPRP